MQVRIEVLAKQVAARAGVSTPLADYALRAVVAGIGGYLSPHSRQLVSEELPEQLAIALASATSDRRSIHERVALTGMTPSQTHELLASVCRVLADELSDEAINLLIGCLPPAVGAMLVPSSPTLPHADTRHRQASSIAEPNPHGESKLSSAPGMPHQRDLATLARWRGSRNGNGSGIGEPN